MKCEAVKEELRRCFDEGVSRDDALSAHLAQCDTCRAYSARLDAVDADLLAMPMANVSPELARRLEAIPRAPAPAFHRNWLIGAAGALIVAALFVGYFYPFPVPAWQDLALDYRQSIPRVSLQAFQPPSMAALKTYAEPTLEWLESVPRLSVPVAWAIAAAALLTLLGINGFEAIQLRAHRDARRIS
jgi:anti-sigma factor RsiW